MAHSLFLLAFRGYTIEEVSRLFDRQSDGVVPTPDGVSALDTTSNYEVDRKPKERELIDQRHLEYIKDETH